MQIKPSPSDIDTARTALRDAEQQELHWSPESLARLRGAVQALDWVLGVGPAVMVPDVSEPDVDHRS